MSQRIRESEGQKARNSDVSDVSDTPRHRGTEAPSHSEFSEFDTIVLEPEDERATIGIDQIRKLQHQLSLKPHSSNYKVGIINEAQRMTVAAQNALLKTLEEPPAHSVLILTTPHQDLLLPTIVSRCQIVKLGPSVDLDLESEFHREAVEDFLKLLRWGRGERLAWTESKRELTNDKLQMTNYLNSWISVLRDLLLLELDCKDQILNRNLMQISCDRSDFAVENFQDALERTVKTRNLISETNVSPRLALEVLLLDLPILNP